MSFALNPDLDRSRIADDLGRNKRIQLPGFLEASGAEELLRHLIESTDWRHVMNAGDKVYEIGCDELAAMDPEQRAVLDRKIDREAAEGFQFRFDTIRVPDEEADRRAMGSLVADFASYLSSSATVDWFRAITRCDSIEFADCQATRYCNGAFLTRHDDAVEGKQRYFAYVLNLTREWRAEWGGLLLFPEDESARIDAMVPDFNLLNLFEVGQQHCVTQVASYAPRPRISVTGWLRSR